MKCPRCPGSLETINYENVTVELCGSCSGVWIGADRLRDVLASKEKNFSGNEIEKTLKESRAGVPKAELEKQLPCPVCFENLKALNYNYRSGVIINLCSEGHGIWFDSGELERVQIFVEYWNNQQAEKQKAWAGLAAGAKAKANQELNEIGGGLRKNMGPLNRIVDSVLGEFKKIPSAR
jgi:Zn-finger nucleic acid-binding protein